MPLSARCSLFTVHCSACSDVVACRAVLLTSLVLLSLCLSSAEVVASIASRYTLYFPRMTTETRLPRGDPGRCIVLPRPTSAAMP
ncbi:hypothetical protein F4780DRAFT_350650 [Xylariomycetidae sp. FL0641]|nr:hypothetical protein F4780DRAFT_350650 [Xylariomycetidae sp. FL0641]